MKRAPSRTLNRYELETLGREWQKRLRLDGWQIFFHLVKQSAIPGSFGMNSTYSAHMRANVSVLDPEDNECDEPGEIVYLPEVTLVHEMLHCSMHQLGLDDRDDLKLHKEQAIQTLATALVSAKYGVENVAEFYPWEQEVA